MLPCRVARYLECMGWDLAVAGRVTFNPNLTPASVLPALSAEQTFSVPGLLTGDVLAVSAPALTAGIGLVGARVSAADTLALTFSNSTLGALVPTAGAYKVMAFRG